MAKKKSTSNVVNNIDLIHMDIDYDKLAEAIVKAQKKAEFKEKSHSKYRSSAMNFLNGTIYSSVYILSGIEVFTVWKDFSTEKDISLISCIVVTLILLFVGVYSFLCQQESLREKESESFAHFNTNVSLVAMIIALVALFRGV